MGRDRTEFYGTKGRPETFSEVNSPMSMKKHFGDYCAVVLIETSLGFFASKGLEAEGGENFCRM